MLDNPPKISIVTPSFNQAQFLEATIESVLTQNYPNLEYIIIDGGSTDGSIEIIKKYESHLHFWCSEKDKGQYDAINKGFAHSTGEIMAWLNSDDMYCPWSLKTVASIMSELSQVEWLTTLQLGGWDWHGFSKGFQLIRGYSKEAFLDGCYVPWSEKGIGWIQQESTFWRRSLWEKVGEKISTELNLAGDFDLWSRFFGYADLYGVSSPLAGFRFQENQKSSQQQTYLLEANKSLEAIRKISNWSPNFWREICLSLSINKIPKFRSLLKSTYSYEGKKIYRRNYDSPNGYWDIKTYQFY